VSDVPAVGARSEWWSRETHVVARGRLLDVERTALCDEGIALLDGIDAHHPATQGEIVQAAALVQTRNTLIVAWECAFAGYVAQALALCRIASEYIGVAWYAEDAPPDVEAWLAFDQPAPRRAGQLLQRVLTDEQLGPTIRAMRAQLHAFVHADTVALGSVMSLDAASHGFVIDAGPVVNAPRFNAVSFFLILVSGLAVLRGMAYVRDAEAEWSARADEYLWCVGEWLERVEP
jgi:hypothetical protein